jgi:hypothetical protein
MQGDSGTPLVYLRKMKNSCDRDFNHTSAVQLDAMKFRFIQLGLVTMQPKRDCKSKSQLRPVVLFTRLSRQYSIEIFVCFQLHSIGKFPN